MKSIYENGATPINNQAKLVTSHSQDIPLKTPSVTKCPYCMEFYEGSITEHLKNKHPGQMLGNRKVCPKCGLHMPLKSISKHNKNCRKR